MFLDGLVRVEFIFNKRGCGMLFAFAAILFALWVVGVLTATMMGGFIHLLVILSVLLVIVRIIQGEHAR